MNQTDRHNNLLLDLSDTLTLWPKIALKHIIEDYNIFHLLQI